MRGESRSRSKSPTRSNQQRGQGQPPCNKVYVTFLPEDIEEAELKKLFEQCGTVTRLFLKKKDDGFTFAHIHYQTVEQATQAIEKLNRKKLNGKNIRVQFGRQMNRGGDTREHSGSRDRGDKFGGDRNGRGGDPRRDSDTRRRFENEGGFDGARGGRGRGGGFKGNDRGGYHGDRNGGSREQGYKGGGDRGPIKCYKCQGVGHISKNCTNQGGSSQNRKTTQDRPSKPTRPIDKMSEDEHSDY